MKIIGAFILLVFTIFNAEAYNQLNIRSTRNWYYYQGNIDKAFLTIKPNGVYHEVSMYLEFSTKGYPYNDPMDTLEVLFDFDLPKGSIINDSWLWVGDSIMQAVIIDKWSANQIYNNIVQVRRDPSILQTNGNDQYSLKVFPLNGNQVRKVKISYLQPVTISPFSSQINLPINLIKTSVIKPVIDVRVYSNDDFGKPNSVQNTNLQFWQHNSGNENYYGVTLQPNDYMSLTDFTLKFKSPLKNGMYFNYFPEDNQKGTYQMAFLPEALLNTSISKKVAILLDYDGYNSPSLSHSTLKNLVKNQISTYFKEGDSVNIILSGVTPKLVSNNWVSCDSTSLANFFQTFNSLSISGYNMMPSVVAKGIDFIQSNGNNGDLLLISNSQSEGNPSVAINLVNDLLSLMGNKKIKTHVLDYMSLSNPDYYWNNGSYFYGNDYFNSNITRLTNANYFRTYVSYYNVKPINDVFDEMFSSLSGLIYTPDLYTTCTGGYCYGRYDVNNAGLTGLNKVCVQTGKYVGGFPFTMFMSGSLNDGQIISATKNISSNDAVMADSTINQSWVGRHFQSLQVAGISNQTINQIINLSIENRVLSNYTAFLALEPNDTLSFCLTCEDESQTTGNEEMIENGLKIFPIPFLNELTIQLDEELINSGIISVSIYNSLGQEIISFSKEEILTANGKLVWNGLNKNNENVSSGIYSIVLKSNAKTISKNVIKQ